MYEFDNLIKTLMHFHMFTFSKVDPGSPRPNKRMVFRMIHEKDSWSYQWAKFGRLGLPGYMIYMHILCFVWPLSFGCLGRCIGSWPNLGKHFPGSGVPICLMESCGEVGNMGGPPKIMGKPPKSSILIGFSIINHPFWGPTPIFGNTHILYLQ